MSKLSDLRSELLSDRVFSLAEQLRQQRMQTRNLAILLHEECDPDRIGKADSNTACGLCGLKYHAHPQVLGDYVLCNGLVVKLV